MSYKPWDADAVVVVPSLHVERERAAKNRRKAGYCEVDECPNASAVGDFRCVAHCTLTDLNDSYSLGLEQFDWEAYFETLYRH